MRTPLNHKGWLRQYVPQPSMTFMNLFERRVDLRLRYVRQPSLIELNAARMSVYSSMMGVVA